MVERLNKYVDKTSPQIVVPEEAPVETPAVPIEVPVIFDEFDCFAEFEDININMDSQHASQSNNSDLFETPAENSNKRKCLYSIRNF